LSNLDSITELLHIENHEIVREEISLIENSEHLHTLALNYNWDDGFDIPTWIINNENCEIGTALLLFYFAEGYALLDKRINEEETELNEWAVFVDNLYKKIINNEFKFKSIIYEPELNKVQKYKLKKNNPNLPDIFLDGIKG
jgi:hypothetical protein